MGRFGEDLAAQHLHKAGYKILERNFRNFLGEIDIIAQDQETICFVEVKTRVGTQFGSPREAVSRQKQFKLGQLALSYLKYKKQLNRKARFDVITILKEEKGAPNIELIKNAFDLTD